MPSVKISLLHSLSGYLAISERPLLDAELLAIEEINSAGGVCGCQIQPEIYDCQSQPDKFALAARKAIKRGSVSLFGCLTSASRKEIRPVIENADHLLWYPVQDEGLEESPAIVYSGSCPNQQTLPAVQWVAAKIGRGMYLIGSDYVYPRTANRLIRALLSSSDCTGDVLGETYTPLAGLDFRSVMDDIAAVNPDVVVSTLIGNSVPAFFDACRESGLSIPVMSLCAVEYELASVREAAVGHYACRSYFQSLPTAVNMAFVSRFRNRYGKDALCAAPLVNAYNNIYLWKAAAEAAGTFAPCSVRQQLSGLSFAGPAGVVTIRDNRHVTHRAHVGKLESSGQFDLLWSSDIIEPLPWLGVEQLEFSGRPVVIEALSCFPDVIHLNADLEREVSERIRVEAALKELNESLDERVRMRTSELMAANHDLQEEVAERKRMERVLADARREAETASLAKSQFLGIISHELRTPMTGVLGMLELALLEELPSNVRDFISVASTSAQALQKVLDAVLDFSDLDNDAAPPRKAPFILRECLESSLSTLVARMSCDNIRWSLDIDRQVPAIIDGDEAKLGLIVVNLLANALKFTRDGEISLRVALSDTGDATVFSISDTGIGIPEDKLDEIFDLFVQADMSDRRAFNGIGLGLSIARRLVNQFGGDIAVSSTVGVGSTFTFTIPFEGAGQTTDAPLPS